MKKNSRVDFKLCPRLSTRRLLSNNFYLIKLLFSAAPVAVSLFALEQFRVNAFIFLEHTWMIRRVLECVEYSRPFSEAILIVIFMAILLTVTGVLGCIVGQWLLPKAKLIASNRLKEKIFEKSKDVDISLFDDPEYYNDFVMTVEKIDPLIDYIFDIVGVFSGMLGTVLTTGVYFAAVSPSVLLLVLINSAVWLFFLIRRSRLRYSQYAVSRKDIRRRDYVKRLFYFKDYAKELRLNPSLKERAFEDYDESYDSIVKTFNDHNIEIVKGDIFSSSFQFLVMDLACVLLVAYRATVPGGLSYAAVVVIINSMYRLRRAFVNIIYKLATSSENCMYVEKCRKFMETEPTVTSQEKKPAPDIPCTLELRNVSFRYRDDGEFIIKNVSFTLKAGEKLALVGYNGAGKTTLIKLIMRLYDPTEGEILLGGINIREYDVSEYRRKIGAVFQDFNIYAQSLIENVVMSPTAKGDEEEAIKALEMSGFKDKLDRLNEGLYTQLTKEFDEKGTELSGGEAQKIAIARAFYKKAPLIILDEPSAALDPIAEYKFNRSIKEVSENSTVIFISHRLSTTLLADRIIMLEKGQICEEGTHNDLLSKGGKYAAMWHTQADRYAMNE